MFYEICVLRNFAKFTWKHLCQSLFFNKVSANVCNFVKKETLVLVFPFWILHNFLEHLFFQNTTSGCPMVFVQLFLLITLSKFSTMLSILIFSYWKQHKANTWLLNLPYNDVWLRNDYVFFSVSNSMVLLCSFLK